jgi:hypothetical protein
MRKLDPSVLKEREKSGWTEKSNELWRDGKRLWRRGRSREMALELHFSLRDGLGEFLCCPGKPGYCISTFVINLSAPTICRLGLQQEISVTAARSRSGLPNLD